MDQPRRRKCYTQSYAAGKFVNAVIDSPSMMLAEKGKKASNLTVLPCHEILDTDVLLDALGDSHQDRSASSASV